MKDIMSFFTNTQGVVDVLLLLTEFCGVILVLITLYKDKRIKQAEFIMNYNFGFISSEPLVEMERKLENCYQIYKSKMEEHKNDLSRDYDREYKELLESMKEIIGFKPLSETNYKVTRGYQKLINYLVYLESFAPLILTDQVQFKDIDDTFGYRYFIAMNNPIVQTYELLEEADYYCGCIRLYKRWYDYRRECNKEIPMEWFALSRLEGNSEFETMNPVYIKEKPKRDFKQIYIDVSDGLESKRKGKKDKSKESESETTISEKDRSKNQKLKETDEREE